MKGKFGKAKADLQNTTTWKSMIITYKTNYICWPTKSTTEQYSNGTLRSNFKTKASHNTSLEQRQVSKDSLIEFSQH
jgi:hypothetical protein